MTDNACRSIRQRNLIARGDDFTTQELQAMERAFHQARAASDGPCDGQLVVRVIHACLLARKAA